MENTPTPKEMGEKEIGEVVLGDEFKAMVMAGMKRTLKWDQQADFQTLRAGYQYRESNWSIGRTVEREGIKIKAFKPHDRWTAWRKRNARRTKAAERAIVNRGTARKIKVVRKR